MSRGRVGGARKPVQEVVVARVRTRVTLWTGAAVLGLALAYLALAVVVGRHVPSTAFVEGVQVGGMPRDVAVATLERDLAARGSGPIRVALGMTGRELTVDPREAGLALDVPGTVDGITGFTLDPVRIWRHLTEGAERAVLTSVDTERLTSVVTGLARQVEIAPKDGSVTFADGKAVASPAVTGFTVPVETVVREVAAAYPRSTSVTVSVETAAPSVTQDEVDAAMASVATPAMSGPVTLAAGTSTASLQPVQLAPTLAMRPGPDGKLGLVVDRGAVAGLVQQALAGLVTTPQDARVVLEGGAPRVLPSTDGVGVDAAGAVDQVVAALTSPDRTAKVPVTVARPAFTTEAAQALGVKEVVASFDSAFPYNPSRTANLVTASNTVNGTLVKPGETFSLNAVLGERTAAKGYQEGYVIENGRLVKGTGGGVSQVSTVVFNLAWFSGATLVEHTPHAFYISRYPEGREATVYWPNVDNKFKNGTPYGMLLQMWVADGQVHGRVWSTKVYDVESVKSPRTNVRPGKTVVDGSAGCVPQPEMTPGFDVTVTRILKRGGAVVKTEQYSTSYQPEDQVVCTNPNHKT